MEKNFGNSRLYLGQEIAKVIGLLFRTVKGENNSW